MTIADKIMELLAESPRRFTAVYQHVMNDGPCDKIYMAFWDLSAKQVIQFNSGTCLYSLKPKEELALR
jgi:acyl-CoA hydrolase